MGRVTAASVYLALVLEWLFLVTKPSMFTVLAWPQRGAVLLSAALVSAIPVTVVALLIALCVHLLAGRWKRHAGGVALVVPAAVLSAAGFLLIENFTKTVFGFNIGSFTSPARYLYAIGWLLLCWRMHRFLARRFGAVPRRRRAPLVAAAALLLATSVVAAWVRYEPRQGATVIGGSDDGKLPNILILSTDGLEAGHMSLFGYDRPTTPFLESRADEFLISENHFSNSVLTGPSIGALLSGKLPLETGVLRAGNTFRGEDVFQHLPGLLRQLGYYNIDISARYWGDPYDMNIRRGFHVANGRSLKTEALPVLSWFGGVYPSELYFVSLTLERLREMLLHAVGIADMKDVYELVVKKKVSSIRDENRIRQLEAEMSRAPRPFFVHMHLLDTHRVPRSSGGSDERPQGGFYVRKPHFSAQAEPQWYDFYDDTIAGYDDYVEEIVARLEASNELDKTLLIINSDHGERRWAQIRLPLMIRFPGAEHRGRLVENTQRADIAPTILTYLGIEPPDWMVGQSLIGGQLDPLRTIVVAGQGRGQSVHHLWLIHCQRSYEFDVTIAQMTRHTVEGHTAPCAEGELLDEAEARQYLFERLEVAGTFAVPFPIQLASLQRDNNPEMRQQAMGVMQRRQVSSLWLGDTIAVTKAHGDLWTNGTRPAAILLRNDGDEPRARQLVVGSGRGDEFPASFFVQDETTTREFVFIGPGSMSVDLGWVEPGADRLFLVWSGSSWDAETEDRTLGVRLHLAGSWLQGLLREEEPSQWSRAAQMILERRVPTARVAELGLAANLHSDLWTRGSEPAGLVVRNEGGEPVARRLVVRSGKEHDFPLRFHLHDGSQSREYLFERPGRMAIDLPEVPPRSDRLFIIRSERGWRPDSPTGRELGVRLSAG